MTDYIAIMLNGLFTGFGVILANWLWAEYLEHRAKKIQQNVKNVRENIINFNDKMNGGKFI